MRKKILIIGHNKSGTRFLHSLFSRSGYSSIHWDKGRLANSIIKNIATNQMPFNDYPGVQVFSDMECTIKNPELPRDYGILYQPYKNFPTLHTLDPETIFIYNFRNIDDWISSRLRHGNGYYAMLYLWNLLTRTNGAACNIDDVIEHWKDEHATLDTQVKRWETISSNSIHKFNLDSYSLDDLNNFLTSQDCMPIQIQGSQERVGVNKNIAIDWNLLRSQASSVLKRWETYGTRAYGQ